MENAAYFDALRSALGKAQRSIVMLGWQFDPAHAAGSRKAAHDDHQAQIGHQLRMLVKSRPELDVRLLIWKSPLLIAASQGFYPHRAQGWFRKRMVEFRLDPPRPDRRLPPPEGRHHRRRRGLLRRRRHLDRPLGLRRASGRRSAPLPAVRPDPVAAARGHVRSWTAPPARALGDLARERWFRSTWERTIADEADERSLARRRRAGPARHAGRHRPHRAGLAAAGPRCARTRPCTSTPSGAPSG